MLVGDTLQAILAKLAGAAVGSSDPTVGSVELNQGIDGALVVPVVTTEGVRITQPAAGAGDTTSFVAAGMLLRPSLVYPARLLFANASDSPVFGQAFNAAGPVAPGAVPVDVIVVPVGQAAEIRYPGPTGKFALGAFIAFSSTLLTYTSAAISGLLGYDTYPDFT